MGLNFVRRGPREDLDPPNDFISQAIGAEELAWAHNDEELVLDFQDAVLDRAERELRGLDFGAS